MINSQITSLNSNIGGAEIEFPYEHWGFNWCIGNSNIEGQNPLIQFGYGQPDQCGSSMATQGAFSGNAAGIAQGDWQAHREDRRAPHGRRDPGRGRLHKGGHPLTRRCEGGGLPVQSVPGERHIAQP